MIARESNSRYYIGWRARTLLVAKEDLRHATLEECAAADVIASDAILTGEQKNYEEVPRSQGNGREGSSANNTPTIPEANPEPGERVYEREDRDVRNFVLSRLGGPSNADITRREVFDLRTARRLDEYRGERGQVRGE